MNPHILLAIDPGKAGGLAWTEGAEVRCLKMPDTGGDIVALLDRWTAFETKIAVLEHQQGFSPPDRKAGANSMFKFGQGYGFLQGCLQAMKWQLIEVRPVKWQKFLSLGSKAGAGGQTPWKNKLKAEAQRLYPGMTVTLNTADALLILRWALKNTVNAP